MVGAMTADEKPWKVNHGARNVSKRYETRKEKGLDVLTARQAQMGYV